MWESNAHGRCTRYCADMCAQPQLAEVKPTAQPPQSAVPATKSAHGGSQSAAPATKSAHGGSQSAVPATKSAHGGSQSAAPATKSAHGGSQSAVPATKSTHGGSQSAVPATKSTHGGSQSAAPATNSARQQTSEYSNHNGGTDGDHGRQPQTTADNATPTASNGAWRFTKRCACHEFWWRLGVCCHKVLRLPRILRVEVHKVLRLPRILRVDKQVNTLITMEGRTGDHRRQPQTTADNATPTASNAAPATNSGAVSVCVVTKCCACHELCTWRFTKCCACHEFRASRNK